MFCECLSVMAISGVPVWPPTKGLSFLREMGYKFWPRAPGGHVVGVPHGVLCVSLITHPAFSSVGTGVITPCRRG